MRDDRLIALATFATAEAGRIVTVFAELPGVLDTGVGKVAGRDAIQIEFDPGRIAYEALLEVLGREQRCATVFWHSLEQARIAAASLVAASVERAPLFYRA